jgi:hypothetical protein
MTSEFPGLVIVQRQSPDWPHLSDEAFRQQSIQFCHLWGKPELYVWELFQLWNSTFAIDYRQVRQQLKQITLDVLAEVQNAQWIPYAQYQNIPFCRDAYYIFLDDDDWVAPDFINQLSRHLRGNSVWPGLLLWRSANVGSPQQDHPVFVWGMNGRCMTNNYAVHGSELQPFFRIKQFIQHKEAVKVFDKAEAPHLDCALTVSNKSPISSVSLDRGLGNDHSSAHLKQLVVNYLDRMSTVGDEDLIYIPWAKLWLERTVRVFQALV